MKRNYYFNNDTLKWCKRKSKLQLFFDKIKPYWWDKFWYTYHWNGIIGPGSKGSKTFRYDRLSLIFAIISFIGVISLLIINL